MNYNSMWESFKGTLHPAIGERDLILIQTAFAAGVTVMIRELADVRGDIDPADCMQVVKDAEGVIQNMITAELKTKIFH